MVTAKLAALKRALVKMRRSTIGCELRSSKTTEAPRSAAPDGCGAEGDRAQPAMRRGLDDGVDDGDDAGHRQQSPDRVESPRVGVRRGRHDQASGDERDGHDRQVHHEDRAPGEVLEQPPAQRRADRDPETGDRRPHGDGLGPLGGDGEDVGQDGERGGHDRRRADPHHHPAGDELAGRGGQGRQRRAESRRRPGRRPGSGVVRCGHRGCPA